MLVNDVPDQTLVMNAVVIEMHRIGHRPAMSGVQVVEHDDTMACIQQLQHSMRPDVACATGNQYRFCCHQRVQNGLSIIPVPPEIIPVSANPGPR